MLPQTQPTPEVIKKIIERPMDKYNLENLRTTAIAKSPITIEKIIDRLFEKGGSLYNVLKR